MTDADCECTCNRCARRDHCCTVPCWYVIDAPIVRLTEGDVIHRPEWLWDESSSALAIVGCKGCGDRFCAWDGWDQHLAAIGLPHPTLKAL